MKQINNGLNTNMDYIRSLHTYPADGSLLKLMNVGKRKVRLKGNPMSVKVDLNSCKTVDIK